MFKELRESSVAEEGDEGEDVMGGAEGTHHQGTLEAFLEVWALFHT